MLTNFISSFEDGKFKDSKIYPYFLAKFPWLKTVSEHPLKHKINLNTIISKKLTSSKDINRHLLGVPNNIAQLVINSGILDELNEREGGNPMGLWKEILRHLDGVQNLTAEMLGSSYFIDSCKMARTLGRRVNCRWGDKRLKEEHDKWGREIGNIVLDCEPEYDLNVKEIFRKFAEYSGYRLLKTNKDMIIEGMVQDHCVGTYIDTVQRGTCAIYHVEGFTLQVGLETKLEMIEPKLSPDKNFYIPPQQTE